MTSFRVRANSISSATLVLAAILFFPGCVNSQTDSLRERALMFELSEDRIDLFMTERWLDSDFPALLKLYHTSDGEIRIEFAIWRDGKVVVDDEAMPAAVDPAEVAALLQSIEHCGFFAIQENCAGVAARAEHSLTVMRARDKVTHHWDEVERMKWSTNSYPTEEYVEFIQIWKCVNDRIGAIVDALP